jgi:hypothetical protein
LALEAIVEITRFLSVIRVDLFSNKKGEIPFDISPF